MQTCKPAVYLWCLGRLSETVVPGGVEGSLACVRLLWCRDTAASCVLYFLGSSVAPQQRWGWQVGVRVSVLSDSRPHFSPQTPGIQSPMFTESNLWIGYPADWPEPIKFSRQPAVYNPIEWMVKLALKRL